MPRRRQSRSLNRRWWRRALVVAVVVLPVIAWLLPRRVHDVVSIDGGHRWEHAEAPPQKRIVWQPAERLPAKVAANPAQASLVRPSWADGGMTLYFTLQREDRSADIYRSRFDGSQWTAGEPVTELNSSADDFGPVLSVSGEELYLYSNRTGGYGGFDLYVARRTAAGWSEPVNLGPRVNSPAHEYDPAVTPDGQQLLFSSNRTQVMQQRLAAAEEEQNDAPIWKATLRAEPGLRQFDIYSAKRSGESATWKAARPLGAVNTSVTNEGEPYVSANGAFLYFASDRANEHGDQANYDIYRARIAGERIFGIENLGPGVNTAANEHDPALSAEGFRIVFSSDRMEDANSESAAPDVYALYVSQASEIYDEAGWDTSHLAVITDNLWFIVLLLLVAALLAALIWYLRQVSLRRAPVPAFFLIALLLHLLLATGAFFVPLDGITLVERIRNQMDKVVATDVRLDSTPQRRETAYEKVADVDAASAADVSPAPREQAQPEQVALATEFNAPQTPSQLDRSRPVRAVIVPPEPEPIQAENPLLNRQRRPLEEVVAADQIELEQTDAPPDEAPAESVQAADVELTKTDSAPSEQVAALDSPRVTNTRPLQREALNAQPTDAVPQPNATDTAQLPFNRQARRAVEQPQPPKIVVEQPAPGAPNSNELAKAQSANVDAVRQADAANITPNVVESIMPANASRATPLPVAAVDAAESSPTEKPSEANAATDSSLPRQDRLAKVDFSASAPILINNDAPAEAAAQQGLAATSPEVKVELDRSTEGGPQVNFETPQPAASSGSQASTVTPDATAAAEAAALPSRANTGLSAVAELFTSKPKRPIEFADATAKLSGEAGLPQGDSSDTEASVPRGSDVAVDRTGDSASTIGEALAELDATRNSRRPSQLAAAGEAIRQELAEIGGFHRDAASPLNRARRSTAEDDAAEKARLEDLAGETATDASDGLASAPGAEVEVGRATTGGEDVSLETLFSGIRDNSASERGMPGIGQLARLDLDAQYTGPSAESPLGRHAARPAFLSYARGKIGLQSMLRLRVENEETKRDLIEAFGGSPETLPAIARGLTWLAQVQHDQGHWQLHNFPKGPGGKKFSGHGKSKSDSAATGLALLPFLGDGHTHLGGKYQSTVKRGLRWLIEHQDDDGNLFTGGEGNAHMYSHGIAAIALCEAYGMTKDEQLREPAQRAIDYVVAAQHKEGGWRYRPGDAGDTSVVGWQVMALKSAQMASLNVPETTLEKARKYLQSARRGKNKAEYGYQRSSGGTPAMTAEGLLCYQYLDAKAGDPQLMRTVEIVANQPPKHGKDTSYYWYYGTQAMFHIQGEPWKKWNAGMQEALLEHQVTSGPNTGTWDPRDRWEQSGGRIMSTSLRLLMLEVTFRHLPLYQALD